MAIQQLTHIGLCVSDLERSRRFYRDLIGFAERTQFEIGGKPTATMMELPDMKMQCVFLERDGVRIELMAFPHPGVEGETALRPTNQLGFTHMALRVDDFDAVLERLEAGGAHILRHTRIHNEALESNVIWVTDPDGIRIELIEMPGDPNALLGEPIR